MSGRNTLLWIAVFLLVPACASAGRPAQTEVADAGRIDAVRDAGGLLVPVRPDVLPDDRACLVPSLESRAYVRANRARAERGLPRLDMRLDLIELARMHALDMAERDYFSHDSPEGVGPGDRARREGVSFRVFAENLARVRYARDPAALAVKGWLASPGHRRNLLDERGHGYRYTGVGAARAPDGTVLISQVFLR